MDNTNIIKIHPTHILVKEIPFTDEEMDELRVCAKATWTGYYEQGLDSHDYQCNSDPFPLFTEENLNIFPILGKLKNEFEKGFYELAISHEGNTLTREQISHMVAQQHGQMPIMQQGDLIALHTHPGSLAYGIFYLDDVDNEKDGGILQLWDPSFHVNAGMRNPQIYEVDTVARRLVIVPTYIWHNVTQYYGKSERISVVCNLSIHPDFERVLTYSGVQENGAFTDKTKGSGFDPAAV